MISIDRRTGSSEYASSLRKLGAATVIEELPYGDFSFSGHGPLSTDDTKSLLSIGIELKTLGDLIQCIGDSRFSHHQLPGIVELYDRSYLIVEGIWRPGSTGVLEIWGKNGWRPLCRGKRQFMYGEVDGFLNSVMNQTPMKVKRTSTGSETAQVIYSLYRWWQKSWDDHKSLKGIHSTGTEELNRESTILRSKRRDPKYRMKTLIMQLPGVGVEKCNRIVEEFKVPYRMALAGLDPEILAMVEDWYLRNPKAAEKAWEKIEWIGKKKAEEIVKTWRGERI